MNYLTYLLSNARNKSTALLLPTEYHASNLAPIG